MSAVPARVAFLFALSTMAAFGRAATANPAPGSADGQAAGTASDVASTITYQGYATDTSGSPLTGSHGTTFRLHDQVGADPSDGQVGEDFGAVVDFTDGLFTVPVDVPLEAFDGRSLWLRIAVDGQWLAPVQEIRPAPYALGLVPGATIKGNQEHPLSTLTVRNEGTGNGLTAHGYVGLKASGLTGVMGTGEVGVYGGGMVGVLGEGPGGVEGRGTTGPGVLGRSESKNGVEGTTGAVNGRGVLGTATGTGGVGVEGSAPLGTGMSGSGTIGVRGSSALGIGVEASGVTGLSASGTASGIRAEGPEAIYGRSTLSIGGVAIRGEGSGTGVRGTGLIGIGGEGTVGVQGLGGQAGVRGTAKTETAYGVSAHGIGPGLGGVALYAENLNQNHGQAAYLVNSSAYHTLHLNNTYTGGGGGNLYLQNMGNADGVGGGDFITAVGKGDVQFRVESNGHAWSDVGFHTPAQDMAEQVAAAPGARPGDVLAIGPDGRLVVSTAAYQTNVAGVYSQAPGFVGGVASGGPREGTIPLAIVGIVSARASAENGPIRPGDLLTTADTPGHAMRAGPVAPQGTILGKALGALDHGTGTIRILVTLQ